MSFFDTNPAGRLLNRFSKDTEAADVRVPESIIYVFTGASAPSRRAVALHWALLDCSSRGVAYQDPRMSELEGTVLTPSSPSQRPSSLCVIATAQVFGTLYCTLEPHVDAHKLEPGCLNLAQQHHSSLTPRCICAQYVSVHVLSSWRA